jgi:large subunit ribosomal protein L34e
MVQRVTYTRRRPYNCPSNKFRIVKTPGGKLHVQYTVKSAKRPRCGACAASLQGIPGLRPKEYRGLKKRQRRVSRAYGGSLCFQCVRDRVVRAFLVEEQKIVKSVLRQRKGPVEAAAPKRD